MLATSPHASWRSRRRVLFTCCLVVAFSTLLWGLEVDNEWVRANVGTLPSFSTTGWRDRLLGGSATSIKPTAHEFLTVYNEWKNSSGQGHCTPQLEQIIATIDGQSIADLESLDVSLTHHLRIESTCDGIPGAGDFYETLLTTPFYHARINLHNQFDGTQIGEPLRLPSDLVEQGHPVRLQIWRLYRGFEGIEIHEEVHAPYPGGKYTREAIADVQLAARGSGRGAEDRSICHGADFGQHEWAGGFWWRKEETDEAWTWYLAECKATKFNHEDASECLAGRRLVFLGDSTTQDMMRNTFWAILGDTYPKESDLPPNFGRIGHYNTTQPGHPERWTTISHLFNGHYDLGKNRLGMNTFRHDEGIAKHDQFFQDIADAGVEVDTLLINSGLHDCWLRPTPKDFVDDFAFGWEYYMKKFREIEERQADGRRPQVIYRYSNTPPYHIDAMLATPMNPQSMEMLNLLERDYLETYNAEQLGGALTYLDSYEVTWPWHFDGEMNTGPHYGRAPWGVGHSKRLVDDMMVQMFLNRLCPQVALRGDVEDEV